MNKHRGYSSPSNIKSKQAAWRKRFKEECLTKMNDARVSLYNSNRYGVNPNSPPSSQEPHSETVRNIITAVWQHFQHDSSILEMGDMDPAELEKEIMKEYQLSQAQSQDERLLEDMCRAEEEELQSYMQDYQHQHPPL